jgi:hypothetical protein
MPVPFKDRYKSISIISYIHTLEYNWSGPLFVLIVLFLKECSLFLEGRLDKEEIK